MKQTRVNEMCKERLRKYLRYGRAFESQRRSNTKIKILSYIYANPGKMAHEIEKDLDLRQPEVSIIIKDLVDDGLVRREKKEVPPDRRGARPNKHFVTSKWWEIIRERIVNRKAKLAEAIHCIDEIVEGEEDGKEEADN